MTVAPILTNLAIETFIESVFDPRGVWMTEAYSDFDEPPREFSIAFECADYAKERIDGPQGVAHFFAIYPDMGGRAVRKTIRLNPRAVPGHEIRYTWEGWGLISILLARGDQPNKTSRITANSERRAAKWQSTYHDWDSPNTWNWKAVASHERRLRRVLIRVA